MCELHSQLGVTFLGEEEGVTPLLPSRATEKTCLSRNGTDLLKSVL